MEIVLSPYKDPSLGLDWPEQTPLIEAGLRARLSKWHAGSVEYQIRRTNHGLGADWPTITLALLSVAGTLFFAIPAAHKKVRESLEEWKKIKENLERLLAWVSPSEEVASYPVELLFLDATLRTASGDSTEMLEFLGVDELPVPTEVSGGFTALKHYLFTFRTGEHIVLVAMDSGRRILWESRKPL